MSSSVANAPRQNDALLQGPKDDNIVGGWTPIENVEENSYVQEIGRFAVMEHNKQTGNHLKFLKVTKGWSQVVAGTNYRLILEAVNMAGMIWNYEAVVWDKPWEHSWTLISFIPLLKN
ncbi:cysteine proteinase inhibitor 1-like [Momordica charantia]|uniref:Cysteine proteinase inhibitor 1-like n=1 Tax=Momordica charantia TaxID=3673 RepID=A0A6J1DHK4_MOMCH|nr:cysteine proteinase inhibitor 1-like [Momordica charantia]XP_022153705.1 cysteine proteinase inhibitor 1-like [Momordica charantia]